MRRIVNLLIILSFTLMLSGCVIGPGRGISLLISVIGILVVLFGVRCLADNSQCDNVNKKLTEISETIKENHDDGV